MSEEPIEITSVPCPNCGHPIPIGQTYCEGCDFGTPSARPKERVSIFVRPKRAQPEPEANQEAPPVLDKQNQHKPGSSIPPQATWPCPNCGRQIPMGTGYCASCGSGSRYSSSSKPPKNNTVLYTLLALMICPLACCGACFLPSMNASDWTGPFILVAVIGMIIVLVLLVRDRSGR